MILNTRRSRFILFLIVVNVFFVSKVRLRTNNYRAQCVVICHSCLHGKFSQWNSFNGAAVIFSSGIEERLSFNLILLFYQKQCTGLLFANSKFAYIFVVV